MDERIDEGRGEIPGLVRMWAQDERLGLPRLVWALACECPHCKQAYQLLFEGRDRPEQVDVFIARLSPCGDCEEVWKEAAKRREAEEKKEQARRRRKKGGKKTAADRRPAAEKGQEE